ncbi:MAG: hypothetical protein QG615_1754 [Nitrospirota bacterium]|nr:hypothetical protein [Nitrospirota bacterium]
MFASVEEAKRALTMDKLASVWFSATKVTVHTAHGTGVFPVEEWRKAEGPRPSVEQQ